MSDPLPAPVFNASFDMRLTDIGRCGGHGSEPALLASPPGIDRKILWQISGIRSVEVKLFQIRQTVGDRKSFAGTSDRGYYLPASSAGIAQLVADL
jgi:hypothetical protein